MTVAVGGSSANRQRSPRGAITVDVRDYGAKADGGVTDNAGPFQAAVDDLAAKLNAAGGNFRGVVFIPNAGNTYIVYKTVWVDHPNIGLKGEGLGSSVAMYPGSGHDVFRFGQRRVETGGLTVGASHRPDCSGKLDSAACPSAGVKWGLRTNLDSFVQFTANPMACGPASARALAVDPANGNAYSDNWGETSKLTVEFCVEPPDGQAFPLPSPVVGMGLATSDPGTFLITVWDDPTKLLVMFKTSDQDYGPLGANRYFHVPLSGAKPYRVAVQIDLDNAACTAFVNHVQVALSGTSNLGSGDPSPFLPGLKFQPNDHAPMMVGMSGVAGNFGKPSPVDLRLYGLRLSNAVRYQANGVGTAQTRADSPATALDDLWSYFGNDAHTVAYLPMTDDPATAGRVVTVQCGGATRGGQASGVFLHSTVMTAVGGNSIEDLCVVGGYAHGQAVSLGAMLDFHARGCQVNGGFHGIGSLPMFANYVVAVQDCTLDGRDSPLFLAFATANLRDVQFTTAGRVAVRSIGSGIRLDNGYVFYSTTVTEGLFRARSGGTGGTFSFSNFVCDFEGQTMSVAAFYCEAHASVPATTLTLKDVFLGTVGPTAALITLKDTAPEQDTLQKAFLLVENFQAYTDQYTAFVDVDGPLWHGRAEAIALKGPMFRHRQKWGAKTNVEIVSTRFVGQPRTGTYYSGAHRHEVRSPADGQFTEWRCSASGVYGTASPPAWVGMRPFPVTPNGLAGYVADHTYITAALS